MQEFQISELLGEEEMMAGKGRCSLSLEWKTVGVIDGESGDDGREEQGWVELGIFIIYS